MSIIVFSVNLGWFPSSGFDTPIQWVLPSLTLGFASAGTIMRDVYKRQDETTLVVKLREGVKFHNGDPLTADEVLFTYRKYAEQPAGSTNLAMIDTANSFARDEHTVVFKLNYSYGPCLLYTSRCV